MISLDEWKTIRTQHAKAASKEYQERFDKGMGAPPMQVLINEMVLRDLISRVKDLEARKK